MNANWVDINDRFYYLGTLMLYLYLSTELIAARLGNVGSFLPTTGSRTEVTEVSSDATLTLNSMPSRHTRQNLIQNNNKGTECLI